MSDDLGIGLKGTYCHESNPYISAFLDICKANGYLWREGQLADSYDWKNYIIVNTDGGLMGDNYNISTSSEPLFNHPEYLDFDLGYIKEHSITVEEFLSQGYHFEVGDSFTAISNGKIIQINNDNLSMSNRPESGDRGRFILYAKCLYKEGGAPIPTPAPTPFQEAGYSKDDIFIIRGKAVKLWKDDGSTVPEFEYVDGVGRLFISLYSLDLIKAVGQYNGRYYGPGLYKFHDNPDAGSYRVGKLTSIDGQHSYPFERDGCTWYKYCDPIDVGELGIATQQKYDKVTLAAFALYSGDMTLKEFAQSDLYDEFLHNAGIE